MEKMREKSETFDLDELVKNIEEEVLEEAREIYTEKTLEEAYNPKNVGELKTSSGAARVTGLCGDTLQIHIKVDNRRSTHGRGQGRFISFGGFIGRKHSLPLLAVGTLRAALEDYKNKNKRR